ncbi:MAG: hypothetical protein ABSD53_09795 [Terriglobales bacterium]
MLQKGSFRIKTAGDFHTFWCGINSIFYHKAGAGAVMVTKLPVEVVACAIVD